MGILSRLLGTDSKDQPEPDGQGERIPVTRYYFVGMDIEKDPIEESIIILEESPEDPTWSVVRCNQRINAPPRDGIHVCVYDRGSVISRDGKAFQANLAWLLSKDEREKLDDESRQKIVEEFPFPERLRDQDIPVASVFEKEELQQLYISLSLDV